MVRSIEAMYKDLAISQSRLIGEMVAQMDMLETKLAESLHKVKTLNCELENLSQLSNPPF